VQSPDQKKLYARSLERIRQDGRLKVLLFGKAFRPDMHDGIIVGVGPLYTFSRGQRDDYLHPRGEYKMW